MRSLSLGPSGARLSRRLATGLAVALACAGLCAARPGTAATVPAPAAARVLAPEQTLT